MTDSIPILPCGQRPEFIRDNGRIEPDGFRRHVRQCLPCSELTDAVRVALSPVTRMVYSAAEAGNTLGLSKRTIYRLCESGSLTSYRIGGTLRIHWIDLENWLDECRARS